MIKKLFYRSFQKTVKIFLQLITFPEPKLLIGKDTIKKLPQEILSMNIKNVLIITDKNLIELGLLKDLLDTLKNNKISFVIYDKVQPNPSIENIEEAKTLYKKNKCKGIIAFGGGSPIDCAKVTAVRASNPQKTIKDIKGYMKIRSKNISPIFAVPTTAGTGSEVTIAAVITDTKIHEKFVVADTCLVPKVAVLDPNLTKNLPKHITSTTGMDALTHAIEAYIGKSSTKYTDDMAKKAVKIIFDNLVSVYNNGQDEKGRENMALASYYGGVAFTQAYVGYVHAIAHALGGMYGVPHGLANAVILPYVLEYYGNSITEKLSELSILVNLGIKSENKKLLSKKFIEAIKDMNRKMNIPTHIKEIKKEDIKKIAKKALKEGNPMYPVPKIFSQKDFENILMKISK